MRQVITVVFLVIGIGLCAWSVEQPAIIGTQLAVLGLAAILLAVGSEIARLLEKGNDQREEVKLALQYLARRRAASPPPTPPHDMERGEGTGKGEKAGRTN